MNRLFLVACLCIVTLSGSAGSVRVAALSDDPEKNEQSSSGGVDAPPASTVQPATGDSDLSHSATNPASRSRREICDTVVDAAHSNDLPIPFFIHLLFQESGFKPDVVSRVGAQGIAQFMPETAATVGLDNPFDPLSAIAASARLLRNLVKQFGNVGLAAAAYNAGPKRIQDWLAKRGKLPEETQHYVKEITGQPAIKWTNGEPGGPVPKLPREAPCQQIAGMDVSNASGHSRAQRGLRLRSMAAAIGARTRRTPPRREALQFASTHKKNHPKMHLSLR